MDKFELMLAPMEGYTDANFRELCYKCGADSTFTEMARVLGLLRHNKSTLEKIQIPRPIPTYIQIFVSDEISIDNFLKGFIVQEGFMGFNINLGCPSPKMIRKGLGCAMIKRVSKVKRIVQTIKKHGYPVSIKMRLGMNQYEKEKKTYLNIINEVDCDFFAVHTRHGGERESDPADFSVYEELVMTKKKIIANGDISSKEQIDYLKSIGVSGAMIGRAAIKNPNIFNELR